jgi:hypothetical protein
MDGDVWWTQRETIENYRRNFASLSRQAIVMGREKVTLRSPQVALYVGSGRYGAFSKAGTKVGGSEMALTVLFVLRDGEWRVAHVLLPLAQAAVAWAQSGSANHLF